ncbi:transposase [Paraburkholderia bryophila]|uniref:transposase n=1 Tax=Paraburkholderia bryophila TaxID=420952 RepID=UPI00234A8A65|nr:transposase [Paraburkholderia bryophila]WCM18339.1 transposase [Paraburkholderia bryophila]
MAQANDPTRSISEVAREHGLNANMISRWRRLHQQGQLVVPEPEAQTFLPVQIPAEPKAPSAIVIEIGAVRIRLEGALDLEVLQTVLAALRISA